MYQELTIVGNAVASPDLRYTPSGVPVANFKLAINKQWTNANGEKQEKSLFLKIVCWRKLAEIVSQYVEKGRQLLVVGELEEPEVWTDREGKQRATMVITAQTIKLLGNRVTDTSNGHATSAEPAGAGEMTDEQIPF